MKDKQKKFEVRLEDDGTLLEAFPTEYQAQQYAFEYNCSNQPEFQDAIVHEK